jgi:tetratricopeptide (TPR) repeat protein
VAISNYAQLLVERGRFSEAEPLMREALATKRSVLPGGHPETLLSVNNLACLLFDQGRLDEAEPLYREALAGFQIALGAGHASARTCAASLEALLRAKAAAAAPGARHRRA